jgi:sulfopropanediol 3-dehydrogenase
LSPAEIAAARACHSEREIEDIRFAQTQVRRFAQIRRDHREAMLCDSIDEMIDEADEIASEHVQVMARDPDAFL